MDGSIRKDAARFAPWRGREHCHGTHPVGGAAVVDEFAWPSRQYLAVYLHADWCRCLPASRHRPNLLVSAVRPLIACLFFQIIIAIVII